MRFLDHPACPVIGLAATRLLASFEGVDREDGAWPSEGRQDAAALRDLGLASFESRDVEALS